MDSPLVRRVLAGLVAVLALALVLLWWWPRTATREVGAARPDPARPVAAANVPVDEGAGGEAARPAPKEARFYTLEDFPDLKDAPPNCQQIVLWDRRNVPAHLIEKNMDAQAMKFDDAEMACLNDKGVPPQVLDRAEHNLRYPQPAAPR
jgi:hypothetical protein